MHINIILGMQFRIQCAKYNKYNTNALKTKLQNTKAYNTNALKTKLQNTKAYNTNVQKIILEIQFRMNYIEDNEQKTMSMNKS